MDNQNPTPNPIPPTENIPVQNPPVQENPLSQVYTAPQSSTPPPSPKSFLSTKILLLIVIGLVLFGAGGTYLALNSKPKPQPFTSKTTPTYTPTSIPTPTPTPNPTANWKTYTSQALGFSIKYPENLAHNKETTTFKEYENVAFSDKELSNPLPSGTIITVSKGSVLEEGYNTLLSKEINKVEAVEIGSRDESGELKLTQVGTKTRLPNITVDGSDALQNITKNDQGYTDQGYIVEILIKRNNIFYQISLADSATQNMERGQKKFNQILSTFRFDSP